MPEWRGVKDSATVRGYQRRAEAHWTKAETLYVEALNGKREVLGLKHPETLTTVSDLTSLLRNMGKETGALEWERALK